MATIAALLVAYASLYLCRSNVEAATPFLRLEGLSLEQLGLLSTVATLAYAVGKIAMGGLGDIVGGRRLMLLAIAGSVVCSVSFGRSHSFAAFLGFAAANRLFLAGGWPGLVQIVSRRFEPARYGRVMGILSTSYELGNACALVFSAQVVRWGWRALFVVNPGLLAIVGGMAVLSLRAPPQDAIAATPDRKVETAADSDEQPVTLREILPKLARSGAFWTTLALSALLTFIRVAFLSWTTLYLSDLAHATGRAEISGAIVKSALFPAAGVVAAVSVGVWSDRLGPGRRAPIIAASLAVVVLLVELLGRAGAHGTLTAALLIGAVGLFLLGPYSLLAGALALDVAGPRGSSTASGVIDAAGYFAGAAAGIVLAWLADKRGWSAVFDLIAAMALAATLIALGWALATRKR
jgi:sugar phosphate permease